MTAATCIFLSLWLSTVAAFVVAVRLLRREAARLRQENGLQGVQLDRMEAKAAHAEAECRRLRERENCRRVFGTDPVTTDEFGAPVG